MARCISVAVLLTMTIIQLVNANAKDCEGKAPFEQCGNTRWCVCPNFNLVTLTNSGSGSPCGGKGNLVCRDSRCLSSGRFSEPKKVKGEYVSCSVDSECGNNYSCINMVCCHKLRGNALTGK